MEGLRRVGLHRRFHAQGTTTRLACLASGCNVAKVLKVMLLAFSLFVSSPSSVACPSVLPGLPVEGYVPFPPFL